MTASSPKKDDVLFEAPVFEIDGDICRVAIVCYAHPGRWEIDIRRMAGTLSSPKFTTQGARFTMSPEAIDKIIAALQAAKTVYQTAVAPAPAQVEPPQ